MILSIIQRESLRLRGCVPCPKADSWQMANLPLLPAPQRSHLFSSIHTWYGFYLQAPLGEVRWDLSKGAKAGKSSVKLRSDPVTLGKIAFPPFWRQEQGRGAGKQPFPGYSSRKLQVPQIARAFFY